ncbi:hypothetical protein [Thauera sp.]|jgi:hypothetical protein|uniref:hypothetical protein n=1 Tax=Thauera sp. TaxID=1905334 RepID=UPI002A36D9AB|nr:hypothetical protein [Thauera sp.]MDX9884634.1 hypothetical protein [Thauera sp.]
MKVAAFSVELQSSHYRAQSLEVSERLDVWRDASSAAGSRGATEHEGAQQQGRVQISPAGQIALASEAATVEAIAEDEIDSDPRLAMLVRMIEFLTGEPVRRFKLSELDPATAAEPPAAASAGQGEVRAGVEQGAARRVGFGMEYDFSATYTESEQTAFGAAGVVRTADGAEIRFELGFSMARSYSESVSVSVRAGDQRLKDPLVLDFGDPAAALSDVRFDFDLDGDGSKELLPLMGGSGFLAFDRNANGRIDDGRELFGPASGDGFAELAALDSDGNQWIDEADAAWSQLRLWQPDADGKGRLQTLNEAGVGAFYLGRVDTPFSLKDAANDTLGLMRASGIYLREDGGVGTVSQVDLRV